ncbi:hypothetical protein D3C74_411460 [compost metagenome]
MDNRHEPEHFLRVQRYDQTIPVFVKIGSCYAMHPSHEPMEKSLETALQLEPDHDLTAP